MAQRDRNAREFDVVLFGATGFTGGLTAERLVAQAPRGCRWALAGRDRERLGRVRDALGPDGADVGLVIADVDDRASLRAMAERTMVLATTVGPYLRYGDGVVEACAQAGTDYVDLTGEAEFVDATYLRHHATAVRTGARLVHACGFDSVPHDLGAWFTVGLLDPDRPITVHAHVRASGRFSGGTAASALGFLGRIPQGVRVARQRRGVEDPPDRPVQVRLGPWREQGDWSLPFPSLDPRIVARSAAALPRYGTSFTYSHNLVVGPLPLAAAAVLGATALTVLAQLPPVRTALEARVPAGSGPDAEQRRRGHFEVRFHGSDGRREVTTAVRGGDPGYDETSRMLAEAALCLAFDDLPHVVGQTTTAVAMGAALTDRLIARGIRFDLLDGPTPVLDTEH
ncbi:saccharopine dehydrogenase family protein [Rhabdothermincola salaria]|uniref:saccharopine dehydrogenase family protein n=1 Tax=Rhabdothermincola salaria TaxID=2903142 RepID=UPI001E536094|nr:saccharopine dehydrogenase NADP-binding domain-containing protein [Rhabdothermincola salaria]MCD9622914.1 saccharopine dehydrogenase NADP-binding domain-containing protein [Rhabdothermincola salaria]